MADRAEALDAAEAGLDAASEWLAVAVEIHAEDSPEWLEAHEIWHRAIAERDILERQCEEARDWWAEWWRS
jgi:hypothetical protein